MSKKILLLVNPFSGTGKSLVAAQYLEKNLVDCTIITVLSEYKGYFIDFLHKEDLTPYAMIVVLGGDGTMHEVTQALAERDNLPPIQLFPCGSGNAFNHDIGNLDWATALEKLKRGMIKRVDIFKMTFPLAPIKDKTLYGFNIVGWGLVSDINASAENMRWLGTARYTAAALIHIFRNPRFKGKVVVDDAVYEGDFCFVLACNTQHTGKAMKIAPLAALDDGLLDVLVIKHVPFFHLLRLFPLIFSGEHIHSKLVIYRKARSITIDCEPMHINIDGESKCQAPFSVEVLGGKLPMIV